MDLSLQFFYMQVQELAKNPNHRKMGMFYVTIPHNKLETHAFTNAI